MTGDWPGYALMAAGVAFASVGPGLVISLLARSDGQAVQYSMILLLASVFFTGFLIKLEALWWPVRSHAWFMAATYELKLDQDVMLRGFVPSLQ
jgi:ABC-2 type transport system permease protein